MPLAIKFSGDAKPELLDCVGNVYQSARMNFGWNVSMYSNLGRKRAVGWNQFKKH